MAQTFDIRFARSAGLAGLFEAPANDFRWKGTGRLSIDASGISVAVKRGLLTLFARTQSRRFTTNSLLHVYREGNALRLEFGTRESPRTVLPFWVSDRNAAAHIVTLLPTQRSVELEDSGSAAPRKYRLDRRLIILVLMGVVTLGAGALVMKRYVSGDAAATRVETGAQPVEPSATQDSIAAQPESPALTEVGPPSPASRTSGSRAARENRDSRYLDPARVPAPSMDASTESAAAERFAGPSEYSSALVRSAAPAERVPTAPVKAAYEIAAEQLALFRAESNVLRAEYLYARDALSYERLEAIEARWLLVTERIVNTAEFGGSEFYGLREMELAVSRNWRDHISMLAAARRVGDQRLMELAAFHLEFAEAVEAQLGEFDP